MGTTGHISFFYNTSHGNSIDGDFPVLKGNEVTSVASRTDISNEATEARYSSRPVCLIEQSIPKTDWLINIG